MVSHSYQLPLSILIDTLRLSRETITLRALLSVLEGGKHGEALAEIAVEQGSIVSCQIRASGNGALLAQGDQALHLAAQVGIVDWQVIPRQALSSFVPAFSSSHNVLTNEGAVVSTKVPVKAVSMQDSRLASLPPKGRQAFLLSDGRRSWQQIVQLLGLSSEKADEVLSLLSERKLITWFS